jgi:hypothetical protein
MTEPFSPAAQAVLDAYGDFEAADVDAMAAALRAAADQVLAAQWKGRIQPDAAHSLGINWTRDALHAIAAELESSDA